MVGRLLTLRVLLFSCQQSHENEYNTLFVPHWLSDFVVFSAPQCLFFLPLGRKTLVATTVPKKLAPYCFFCLSASSSCGFFRLLGLHRFHQIQRVVVLFFPITRSSSTNNKSEKIALWWRLHLRTPTTHDRGCNSCEDPRRPVLELIWLARFFGWKWGSPEVDLATEKIGLALQHFLHGTYKM